MSRNNRNNNRNNSNWNNNDNGQKKKHSGAQVKSTRLGKFN